MATAQRQLEEERKAAEESQRQLRNKETVADSDLGRVEDLENQVRQLRDQNLELEKHAQEAIRKLRLTEKDLDKAEDRAETFETKARALEEELTKVCCDAVLAASLWFHVFSLSTWLKTGCCAVIAHSSEG